MFDENAARGASPETLSAQRVYALLYKLSADVRRLETLLRAVKKQTEELKKE